MKRNIRTVATIGNIVLDSRRCYYVVTRKPPQRRGSSRR
jgi:hypothetical protein